jgi:hypothetical protein
MDNRILNDHSLLTHIRNEMKQHAEIFGIEYRGRSLYSVFRSLPEHVQRCLCNELEQKVNPRAVVGVPHDDPSPNLEEDPLVPTSMGWMRQSEAQSRINDHRMYR